MRFGLFFLIFSSLVLGAPQKFNTLYQSTIVLPKNHWEKRWELAGENGRKDVVYTKWQLHNQLRYGLTEKLTGLVGVGISHTTTKNQTSQSDTTSFDGLHAGLQWMIKNPFLDGIGILSAARIGFSGDTVFSNQRLTLDIQRGSWLLATNAIYTQFIVYDVQSDTETSSFFWNSGLLYQKHPSISAGIEINSRTYYDGISSATKSSNSVFLGPVFHVMRDVWWMTTSLIFQLSGSDGTDTDLNLSDDERLEFRIAIGRLL